MFTLLIKTIRFHTIFFNTIVQLNFQDDSVIVNGVVFNKPFVEKPVDAEDHNIIIYYPVS